MTKNTKLSVVETETEKYPFEYRLPLKFGGRIVKDVTVFRVSLTLEDKGRKKSSHGLGEMTMGTAWAWPTSALSPEMALKTVVVLAEKIASAAKTLEPACHPVHLSTELKSIAKGLAVELANSMNLLQPIPDLAIALALAPTDIALHDAFGRLHDANSFDCFTPELVGCDLSTWLGEEFVGKHFSEILSPKASPTLALYHLVGSLDPLSTDDLNRKIGDGLPETLEEWIRSQQLSHLKIKLTGKELDADVGRVVEIDRISTRSAPTKQFSYSLDFNEACENEDYVIDFLERLERLSKDATGKLHYIEQPMQRDLRVRKEVTMHRVSRLKPVVIDESLTDLEMLQFAKQQGYSGIAIKACKGITDSVLLSAAAKQYGMKIYVQDLTCVGSSFMASAALASRIQGVTAVEGNGRQYCPAGNKDWESLYRPMFKILGGVVPTELLHGKGMGFAWPRNIVSKKYAAMSTPPD
ncbi:MAG: enolase C-terminal domain-like protein [Planctomycetota bacterium]|jgi:L-alanine-DL-glutamate epimerase-like enolase superfamily enzyme